MKDPRALLRYALPIDNKPIKDIQLPLELITEDLRLPGLKALDGVERVSTPLLNSSKSGEFSLRRL